jgi:hypothetical protein
MARMRQKPIAMSTIIWPTVYIAAALTRFVYRSILEHGPEFSLVSPPRSTQLVRCSGSGILVTPHQPRRMTMEIQALDVLNLGIEVDDALAIAEQVDV